MKFLKVESFDNYNEDDEELNRLYNEWDYADEHNQPYRQIEIANRINELQNKRKEFFDK